jgi:hypothetical protein
MTQSKNFGNQNVTVIHYVLLDYLLFLMQIPYLNLLLHLLFFVPLPSLPSANLHSSISILNYFPVPAFEIIQNLLRF